MVTLGIGATQAIETQITSPGIDLLLISPGLRICSGGGGGGGGGVPQPAAAAASVLLRGGGQRSREIGLRLAVGALAQAVLLQFLIEAVVLSALGGRVGTVIATVASYMLSGRMAVP